MAPEARHHLVAKYPNLILCDLRIPVMDRFERVRRVRRMRHHHNIRRVAMIPLLLGDERETADLIAPAALLAEAALRFSIGA